MLECRMNVTQENIDSLFAIRFGHCGEYTDKNDLDRIVKVIKDMFNVNISRVEAQLLEVEI